MTKWMNERIEEFIMREELITLTAAELENCTLTHFPEPRRVYAWIGEVSRPFIFRRSQSLTCAER